MNKIEEIFKSWKIAYNPNDLESELAIKRMEICDTCSEKVDIPFIHCGVCKCMLSKKIYSPKTGACPKGKWAAVEIENLHKRNRTRYDKLK